MSASTETRILFVGDMHLGRQPKGLPEHSAADKLGPRHAWHRVVQAAVTHQVHAVALAGDLVQDENALFEAFGLLELGVRKLSDAGIAVCAVAGNHDTAVLPNLANKIDDFHLLGPGGSWSAHTIHPDQGPDVRLVGWSFPARHHRGSPLDSSPPVPDSDLVTLGLLHADLDAGTSNYAPVARTALLECGYDGWFLGHIHQPDDIPADNTPFYLGSLSPLSTKETGRRGPVLVTISGTGKVKKTRLPLAPLRWENLTIDCQDLKDPPETLRNHLLEAIHGFQKAASDELDETLALGLRLVLVGQVDEPTAFYRTFNGLALEDLVLDETVFVQKITNQVTGNFDLEGLARHDHPAGILARHILLLEGAPQPIPGIEDPEVFRSQLLAEARSARQSTDSNPAFSQLEHQPDDDPGDEVLAHQLSLMARDSLAWLLETRKAGHAAD